MNGYGILGLAKGISAGVQLGTQLRGVMDQNEVRSVMSDGLDQAKASREKAITDNIQIGDAPNADNTMTTPTYKVGDQSYGDQGAARKAAESKVGSMDDFYMRDVVPRIAETYIKQGNMQAADQWNSWAEQKSTQTGMKHWTKALRAGQMGDFKTYADNMVKAYNTPGYYDDGLEADGYDLVKDKEGNTTGLTLNLKNKQSGEKFSQTIHGQEDMVRMGIGLLDPANAFKTTQAAVTAAQAAKAKTAEGDLKFKRDVYRDDRKGDRASQAQTQRDDAAMDRLATGKQMDAANKKQEIELKNAAGQLFKKGASPEEAKRMLVTNMAKQYVDFRGNPTKSAEEIGALADQYIEQIYSGKQGNPLSGGIPSQGAKPQAAPAGGGVPMIYDSKTGEMVPYKR